MEQEEKIDNERTCVRMNECQYPMIDYYYGIRNGRAGAGTAAAVAASTKEVQYNITCIQLEFYKKLLL